MLCPNCGNQTTREEIPNDSYESYVLDVYEMCTSCSYKQHIDTLSFGRAYKGQFDNQTDTNNYEE